MVFRQENGLLVCCCWEGASERPRESSNLLQGPVWFSFESLGASPAQIAFKQAIPSALCRCILPGDQHTGYGATGSCLPARPGPLSRFCHLLSQLGQDFFG
jgi:hypothetical protein